MLKNGAAAGVGFFFWLIAARIMSPRAVGLSSGIISIIRLLGLLALFGLEVSIVRYYNGSKNSSELIRSLTVIITINSLVFGSLFLLFQGYLAPELEVSRQFHQYILVLIGVVIVSLTEFSVKGIFVAQRRAKHAFLQFLFSSARIPLLLLYMGSDTLTILVAFIGGMGAGLIVPFYTTTITSINKSSLISIDKLAELARFSIVNYIARILEEMPPYALPILVVSVLGARPNAQFYISWSMSLLFLHVPRAISQSLFAEGLADSGAYNLRRYFLITLAILIPGTVIIIVGGPTLLSVFGETYASAAPLLSVLVLASFPYTISAAYVTECRINDHLTDIVWVYLAINIVVFPIGTILMGPFRLMGIGIGWLIANIVASAFSSYKLYKRHRPQWRI